MNRAVEDLGRSRSWLAEDLGNLIADTEDLLIAAAAVSDISFAEVRRKFEQKLQFARVALEDALRPALERAGEAVVRADRSLRRHPWAAVVLATVGGVVIGLLAGRRSSSCADDE